MADPVRVALQARLLASTGVTSLLGAPTNVFHRKMSQTTKPPAVLFDKRSGVPDYDFGGGGVERQSWAVRGVAFARTADRAEDIGLAIDAALTDAPLTITGRKLLAIYRESDIDFPEQIGKEIFQHCGGVYVVVCMQS